MKDQKKTNVDLMTSPERMLAIMTKQKPDRVPFIPFIFGFCARNVGYPVRTLYDDAEKSFWAQMWTQEMFGYDGSPIYGYASIGGWEFGGEIKMPESIWEAAPVVTRFPAQTPEEVEALQIPDVETAGAYPIALKFAKIQQQFNMPVTIPGFSIFTAAGNITEVDKLCRWILKKPQTVHTLLRKCTDFYKKVIDYYIKEFPGYPMSVFDGDATAANQIISSKQFEEFVFPYYKEAHQYIIDKGINSIFTHICGEQNLNLPYWQQIEFGDPGIVSFGHEVDLEKAVDMFGDKNIIAGNVNPSIIQEGHWQQVYELSKKCIEKAKNAPSGYVLMSGCDVPVQAVPFNLYAMKKAVMDHGFYD